SSEAFIQCPLTFDQNVLQLHLDGLNTGLVPNQGTDLAAPLSLALRKFNNNESQEPKSKSVILISDGEDFGDDLNDVLDDINEANVKVFTVGVGTYEGATIPSRNGIIMDPNSGSPALSKLETSNLKRIASQTDGAYFELSDEIQEIPQLVATIEKLEGAVT